jgi:hypothetical protein
MMYGILAFFIGNQISTALISTGAFEILINDNIAFSKLQTGKMPDINILNVIFRANGINLQ